MTIPEFISPIQTPPVGIHNEEERTNIAQETIEGVTYATVPGPYDEVPTIRHDFNALERHHGPLIANDFDGWSSDFGDPCRDIDFGSLLRRWVENESFAIFAHIQQLF